MADTPHDRPAPPRLHCPVQHPADVVPCEATELQPLLDRLQQTERVRSEQTFPRGTLTADGRLDLCKQSLGPGGAEFLFAALPERPGFDHVLLGADGIGDPGAVALADFIRRGGRLRTAFLGCNLIGPDGARALADACGDDQHLRGLWLKRNPLGDQGALEIARLLHRSRHLRTLDLVNTGFGPAGLRALTDALVTTNRSVERLYLGSNGLGPWAGAELARLLQGRPGLRHLFVSAGHLGDCGVTDLAAGLRHAPDLEQLALGCNGIGPAGLDALLDAAPPTLRSLDLGHRRSATVLGAPPNDVGAPGARRLADWLAADPALEALNLSRCGLRSPDLRILLDALPGNTHLRRMTLGGGLAAGLKRRIRDLLGARPPAPTASIPADVAAIRSVYRNATPNSHRAEHLGTDPQ